MDFRKIDEDELRELVEFFAIDVVATDEDNPTKKEILAALKALPEDEKVSDEDYETFKQGRAHAEEVKANSDDPDDEPVTPSKDKWAGEEDKSDWQLVKFEGNNPRIDMLGFTFEKKHPFKTVPPEVAEILVLKHEGFRLAMASELQSFYN